VNEKPPAKAPADKPAVPEAPSSSDRYGMALAIVIFGCGFLSTGSLIHDSNMIGLGAVFCAAGVGVAIWAFLKRSSKAP
jgi:hypothetical protein